MTIFDYIKDILVTKKGDLPLEQYVPYMVSRWLSFINPVVAETVNQLNSQVLLENKDMHYKIMLALFPKMKYAPRINYIKKVKEQDSEEDKRITFLSKKYELSKKEITQMLAFIET